MRRQNSTLILSASLGHTVQYSSVVCTRKAGSKHWNKTKMPQVTVTIKKPAWPTGCSTRLGPRLRQNAEPGHFRVRRPALRRVSCLRPHVAWARGQMLPTIHADGTSQTDALLEESYRFKGDGVGHAYKISTLHATLVEDHAAANRRIAMSRVMSALLVITTTISCLLLQWSGMAGLALGRIVVAVMGCLWFYATFTEIFLRDTRRACNGISLLCFACWSLVHVVWQSTRGELAASASEGCNGSLASGGTSASPWVWVDIAMAWVIAPVAGGSLQLSLWASIVPTTMCVSLALAYSVRADEAVTGAEDLPSLGALVAGIIFSAFTMLSISYQVLWQQARDGKTLAQLKDEMTERDVSGRQAQFSELLLRHLVTEPALKVLNAGVQELFSDSRIFVMHRNALEQIYDGVVTLTDYGEKALKRLGSGAPELPTPVAEDADMEEILDACLRTTAYLAVSRDNHKVRLEMRVGPDVNRIVKTFRVWLSQMTRACLIHALHPEEEGTVILRVSYTRPGLMRVGVEAVWRADSSADGEAGEGGRRLLAGWDKDMPAAAWWVRAAAMALGGAADYDASSTRPGFNELWFTIPAQNVPDPEEDTDPEEQATGNAEEQGGRRSASAFSSGKSASGGEMKETRPSHQVGSQGPSRAAPDARDTSTKVTKIAAGDLEREDDACTKRPTTRADKPAPMVAKSALPRPSAVSMPCLPPIAATTQKRRPTLQPLTHRPEALPLAASTKVMPFNCERNSSTGADSKAFTRNEDGKKDRISWEQETGRDDLGKSLSDTLRVSTVEHSHETYRASKEGACGTSAKRSRSAPLEANAARAERLHHTADTELSCPSDGGKRGSLAVSVRSLLGTEEGLEKLKWSMQNNEEDTRAAPWSARVETPAKVDGIGALRGSFARPSSAPGSVQKKASVFGGLVQTLVDSNSMNWLSTTKTLMTPAEARQDSGSEEDSLSMPAKLKVLLVDPQGLVRWVVPRLQETKRRFGVAVAHSAEEGLDMILSGGFGVAVVDLHMPSMSGIEFCRALRATDLAEEDEARSVGLGSLSARGSLLSSTDRTKVLLHTTAAGTVKSDVLEAFLEEDMVEQYVPQPLDITTLFDFLKLFEEGRDEPVTRKLSLLLDDESRRANAAHGAGDSAAKRLVRTLTARMDGETAGGACSYSPSALTRWWSSRKHPAPAVTDLASTFFAFKTTDEEAEAAAMPTAETLQGDGRSQYPIMQARPWRPGPAPLSPSLGEAWR